MNHSPAANSQGQDHYSLFSTSTTHSRYPSHLASASTGLSDLPGALTRQVLSNPGASYCHRINGL